MTCGFVVGGVVTGGLGLKGVGSGGGECGGLECKGTKLKCWVISKNRANVKRVSVKKPCYVQNPKKHDK